MDKITYFTVVHSKYRLKLERKCVPPKKVFAAAISGEKKMKKHTSDSGMREKTQNWFKSAASKAIDHVGEEQSQQ